MRRLLSLLVAIIYLGGPGGDGVRAQAADDRPWWNETVFYQVFVRSFYDGGDDALACDGIGDLQGLLDRLDYLNDGDPNTTDDLGVTGLWLMPIMQSPSYHGYDVVDYYTVEADYGTNADFKRLIDAAHARGLRIIVDLVINHSSDAHPWFAEAVETKQTYRDWYRWRDEEPDYRGPWDQRVWHERVGEYYYGIFGPHMPDLNLANPEVTGAVQDIARFWLEEMGADGFRLDAIRHIIEDGPVQQNTPATHAWLQNFYRFYKGIDEDVFTVGEVWDRTENIVPYITDRELDLAFDFDLADAIVHAVNEGTASPVAAQQAIVWNSYPTNQVATFLRNHDQNRVMSDLGGDVSRAKLAAMLLLTSPGVPFLYYGEEIGMTGTKPDPKIRTPMQWEPGLHAGFTECMPWQAVNAGHETVNVATEAADLNSLLHTYRALVHLRNDHPALLHGDYVPVDTGNEAVYAFVRGADEEAVLAVFNMSNEPVQDYSLSGDEGLHGASGSPEELVHGASVRAPSLSGQGGFSQYKPVDELAPRSGYLLRWDR